MLEYSDNYADSSGNLWQFKRDEQNMTDAGNLENVTTNDSSFLKYKSSLLGESAVDGDNKKFKDVKIVVPLKYLSKFFRSKLYVPIVTLSANNVPYNENLTKQLNEGFKRHVYSKIETQEANANNPKRFPYDASFQGVDRLLVLAFNNTDGANRVQRNSHRKYFLPRVNITNDNVLIDGKNFYDQPISDQIRKYDEI